MSYIDFQHEGHVYRVNGSVIPSVTQVLAPLYDWTGIPWSVLEQAAERGTAVHKAAELHDLEILDEESLDEEVAAYLAGWRKFLADTGFVADRVETKVHSEKHGYAGTVDRTGKMKRHNAVVDIKSGVVTPVTGPQIAAYAEALTEQSGSRFTRRYGVYLRPHDYRLIRYQESTDWHVFRSALNLHRWRRNHGT